MQRIPLHSSGLAGIGYDLRSRILEVEFRSGSVYEYLDVSAGEYVRFLEAESHGNYFALHIRDVYKFRRVR